MQRRPHLPRFIGELDAHLAALALLLICSISLANVIVRYATQASFAATEELSVALLVIVSLFGAAHCSRHAQHIRIEVIEQKLPASLQRCLQVLQSVLIVGLLILVIYYGGVLSFEEYQWQTTSAGLGWPIWWYLIWLPLGAIVMVWRTLQQQYQALRNQRP